MAKVIPMNMRSYKLTVMRHEESGWYFAICTDLPSFLANAKSLPILRERSRDTIIGMLEREGHKILKIKISPPNHDVIPETVDTVTIPVTGQLSFKHSLDVVAQYDEVA